MSFVVGRPSWAPASGTVCAGSIGARAGAVVPDRPRAGAGNVSRGEPWIGLWAGQIVITVQVHSDTAGLNRIREEDLVAYWIVSTFYIVQHPFP